MISAPWSHNYIILTLKTKKRMPISLQSLSWTPLFHTVDRLEDSFPKINLCWFNSLCSLCLVGGLFGGRLDGQWPSCRHCEGGLALRPFWTIPLLKSVKKETLLELARRRKRRESSQLGKGLAGFLIRFIDIEIELLMRRLRRRAT